MASQAVDGRGTARVALLERERELGRIEALLDSAAGGEGRLLLIEGEAGIGKTALLEVLVERALAAEGRVLRARGGELEREFPHGVVRQLYEPLAREGRARQRTLLTGAAELAAPVLRLGQGAGELAPPGPDAAFAAKHGLYWLTANLADEAPLVLVVDDAHWADPASLAFLHYLGRRLEGVAVLLALALRPLGPAGMLELLDALRALPEVELLGPAPLSERASGEIVERLLGAPPGAEFGRACHEVTGGNPFLLVELLRALSGQGVAPADEAAGRVRGVAPQAISHSALGRLAVMWPEAIELARAVAVLDTDAELRHAAALAGLESPAAARAADALTGARVLAPGRPLRFSHPIVRRAVYQDLAEAQRSVEHERAARILDAAGDPDRAASHLLATEPLASAWVVDRLRAAAGRALARGAPGGAAELLRRALAEPPSGEARVAVLRELGAAELLAGEPAGFEHLGEARKLSEDPVEQARIALELSRALALVGDFEEVERLLGESLAETEGGDRELTLSLEAELAMHLLNVSTTTARLERLEPIAPRLDAETQGERLALACLAGYRCFGGGSAAEAVRLGQLALGDGQLLAEQGPGSAAVMYVISVLFWGNAYEAAEREAARMLELARRRGSLSGAGTAAILLGNVAFHRGELRKAEAYGHDCVRDFRELGWTFMLAPALGLLVATLTWRGGTDTALAELEQSGFDGDLPRDETFAWLLWDRGGLHVARGELERGLQDLREAGRRILDHGNDNPGIAAWRSDAALACLALGEREEAVRLADEELELAQRWGTPRAIGVALRARALCEEGEGRIDGLKRAVETLERSEARLERARTLCDLGVALRQAGRRRDAREPLRAALDLATSCGATPLAERAREELVTAGARPRRAVLSGPESLTASELRVATLAVEGRTNREIAQALFVTRRTVEVHLTSTYRKLEIDSREELPGALDGERLVG